MWFGLPDGNHANEMITQLADATTNRLGMRIISSRSAKYDGSGYHFGSVWPCLRDGHQSESIAITARCRRIPILRANALLALDGSLGHVTEVLSGDYYQSLSTASPHQIWSAAMVISPILRGLFGLETDAEKHRITLTPMYLPTGLRFPFAMYTSDPSAQTSISQDDRSHCARHHAHGVW